MTTHMQPFGRRTFLAGTGAAAVALALAACSPAQPSPASSTKKPQGRIYDQPAGDVPAKYAKRQRVVAWTTWGAANGEAMTALADKFNNSQTDIYLDLQSQNSTYDVLAQKLAAGLQAGQIPDLAVFSEVTWHKFFLNDTLEPLDDYFTSSFKKDVYDQQLLKEGVLSKQLWWVPFARSTPLFYYNKELFQKVGLPDRAPKTWKETREWSKELKGFVYNGSQPKMMAYPAVDGDWMFQGVLWNFGGGISRGLDITIDSAASIAAGEFQRAFVNDDKMAYMTAAPLTDFENGLIATAEDSTGALRAVVANSKFEVGVAPVPGQKSQEVPTGGGGFSIMAGASPERKKGAFEFLKFLAQPENSAFWTGASGYLPSVKNADKQKAYKDLLVAAPGFQVAVDQLATKTRQEDAVRLFVPNANITLYQGLQEIWSKNTSVKKVFGDVANTLQQATDQIRPSYEKRVK